MYLKTKMNLPVICVLKFRIVLSAFATRVLSVVKNCRCDEMSSGLTVSNSLNSSSFCSQVQEVQLITIRKSVECQVIN